MVAAAPSSVLERIIASSAESLSPESARVVLGWNFSPADHEKMTALLEKSKRGELTPDEFREVHDYAQAGDILSLLHLKARMALGLPLATTHMDGE